ncbi:MAG: hypothetical protein Q8S55_00950 [Methylococcaceae bacterium]|nr:hypothetical protein [Methylococcaceae bacterium]
MSGINQSIILDVCRLKGIFVDDIGQQKAFCGTGFWIKDGSSSVLVTNKHNVDASIAYGNDTEYRLVELEIELRLFQGGNPTNVTKFFKIADLTAITCSPIADAAILRDPTYTESQGRFRVGGILSIEDLADQSFLENKVQIMDVASFIGFPGTATSQWWDSAWNFGVARSVNIASLPGISFSHTDLRTSDVTLVSGLSFSGASGSVVMLHEKSIKPGAGLQNPSYVPPKIIGIMSGHWPEPGTTPGMFSHSGLSYYTRSTSVLSLL